MKIDSLASKAFLEIRKKILSNQLPPNTRLKEDEWAKKIGVSRMAVREALTRHVPRAKFRRKPFDRECTFRRSPFDRECSF